MSDSPLKPHEAIKLLYRAIEQRGVTIVPKYVAQDLASLRLAHSDDVAYANAIHAVAREILVALRSPATHGVDTEFDLAGWRRCKFPSIANGPPHLRLMFRQSEGNGLQILAFGDRNLPQSVYLAAKTRS